MTEGRTTPSRTAGAATGADPSRAAPGAAAHVLVGASAGDGGAATGRDTPPPERDGDGPDPVAGDRASDEPHVTARAAADRAGVRIHPLTSRDDLVAAGVLLDRVWGVDPEGPGGSELQPHLLRALEHSGNYLFGAAFATPGSDAPAAAPLVGASIAFLGRVGDRWALHSHITGVLSEAASRGVGAALKWHQRAWCLDRGIDLVTWTFDPLIARNAWFNLGRLGARPVEYLVDFYGPMADGRNKGQPTDRLGIAWDLSAPSTSAAAAALRAGAPVRAVTGDLVDPPQRWLRPGPDGRPVSVLEGAAGPLPAPRSPDDDAVVAVPDDAEKLWVRDPATAGAWRLAVRDVLGAALVDPRWTVAAFRPGVGYVLVPAVDRGTSPGSEPALGGHRTTDPTPGPPSDPATHRTTHSIADLTTHPITGPETVPDREESAG